MQFPIVPTEPTRTEPQKADRPQKAELMQMSRPEPINHLYRQNGTFQPQKSRIIAEGQKGYIVNRLDKMWSR